MKRPKLLKISRSHPSYGHSEQVEINCDVSRYEGEAPENIAFIECQSSTRDIGRASFELDRKAIPKLIRQLKSVDKWLRAK